MYFANARQNDAAGHFFVSHRPGVFAVALAIQYYGCDETADFPMD
jgi:hypothetical protein